MPEVFNIWDSVGAKGEITPLTIGTQGQDLWAETPVTNAKPGRSSIPGAKPLPPRGFFAEAGSALGQGVTSTMGAIGATAEMFGVPGGETARNYWERRGQDDAWRRPDYLTQGDVLSNPQRLVDWRWWVRSLGENAPNMAAMMLPGVAAARGAQALNYGAQAIRAAGLAGSFAGSFTMEAGGAYSQAKQEMEQAGTFDADTIERLATMEGLTAGTANALIELLPFDNLFLRQAGADKILKRIARQTFLEGSTESAQEAVNIYVEKLGHKPDQTFSDQAGRILEAGIIGGAMGGIAGGTVGTLEHRRSVRGYNSLADQLGVKEDVAAWKQAGMPDADIAQKIVAISERLQQTKVNTELESPLTSASEIKDVAAKIEFPKLNAEEAATMVSFLLYGEGAFTPAAGPVAKVAGKAKRGVLGMFGMKERTTPETAADDTAPLTAGATQVKDIAVAKPLAEIKKQATQAEARKKGETLFDNIMNDLNQEDQSRMEEARQAELARQAQADAADQSVQVQPEMVLPPVNQDQNTASAPENGDLVQKIAGGNIEGFTFPEHFSPMDLNGLWDNLYTVSEEIAAKNQPTIQALQQEREQLKSDRSKEAAARKKQISDEVRRLESESQIVQVHAENAWGVAQDDMAGKAVAILKAEGIAADSDTVYDAIATLSDGRQNEQGWNQPLLPQVVDYIKEEKLLSGVFSKSPDIQSTQDQATPARQKTAVDLAAGRSGQAAKTQEDKATAPIVEPGASQQAEAGTTVNSGVSGEAYAAQVKKLNDDTTRLLSEGGYRAAVNQPKSELGEADLLKKGYKPYLANEKGELAVNVLGVWAKEGKAPPTLPAYMKGVAQNSIDSLRTAVENKDTEKLKEWLHLGNKNLRKYFTDFTGVRLPKTVAGTKTAIDEWAKKGTDTRGYPDLTISGQGKPIPTHKEATYVVHKRKPDSIPDTFKVVMSAQKTDGGGFVSVYGTGMTAEKAYDQALSSYEGAIKERRVETTSPAVLTIEMLERAVKSGDARGDALTAVKGAIDNLKGGDTEGARLLAAKAQGFTGLDLGFGETIKKPDSAKVIESKIDEWDGRIDWNLVNTAVELFNKNKDNTVDSRAIDRLKNIVKMMNDETRGQYDRETGETATEDITIPPKGAYSANQGMERAFEKAGEIKSLPTEAEFNKAYADVRTRENGKHEATASDVYRSLLFAKNPKVFPEEQQELRTKHIKEAIGAAPDLSTKSTGDLVKDMFDIINEHIGKRGSIPVVKGQEIQLDENLYQKLKPYLAEIVSRAKAKALDAKAYLFGAVDSMPEGPAKAIYEKAASKYIDGEKGIDITEKEGKLELKGEPKDERPADGSASSGTLESDQPGNLPADGRGQGPGRGERGSGKTDTRGDESTDAGEDVGAGSLAGKPTPIHLSDSETTGEGLPAGSSSGTVADQATPASEPRSLKLSGDNPGNYRITEDDHIGSGTRGQRIDRNLAAIRLIKQLEKEGRYPTKAEQSILAKYVGWGGLKSVFDTASTKPQDTRAREELERTLSKNEFLEAFLSITNAHYTSPQVIGSMYDVLRHMGFEGGNVLEPTYGAGNFIGLMPEDMAAASKWYGSELDPITAKIGQFLYPDSQLIESGFQVAEFPFGKFDLAIGNPPFGDTRIADTKKSRAEINRFKIHNYVISKEAMHLKPGGILANVVTTRFLDTADAEAREFLAKNFKFLGAIRLPNDAFTANAGTEVTTDIIFLQRLMPGEKGDLSADWLTTGATMKNVAGEEITLNKYFANNSHMMLGEPSMKGTMYGGAWKEGGKGEFTLDKRPGDDMNALINKLIKDDLAGLKDIANERTDDKADAAALSLTINKEDVGIGGFYEDGDKIYMRGDDDAYNNPTFEVLRPETQWTEKTKLGETRYNRIKGMLNLRQKAYKLIEAERFDLEGIEKLRKELNRSYDYYVKTHGFLSEAANFGLMADDVKIEFGLESNYKKEITAARAKAMGIAPAPAMAEKASLLKGRVFYPSKEIIFAKDVTDGYGISLSQRGKLDVGYIATLTGKTEEAVTQELSDLDLAYQDPETKEWIQEDAYLSGNVKAKHAKAVEAGMEKNAAALKRVFPEDKTAEKVYAGIGATWIPREVLAAFGEFIGINSPRVMISHDTGKVFISGSVSQNDVNVAWQQNDYSMTDIFNAAAGHKTLIAYDGTGDDRAQNKDRTRALATIVKQVKSTFDDWLMADDARSRVIVKEYNDTQNTHAERQFGGKHLKPVGASPAIDLRNTQRDAAWRMVQSPIVLLDHAVGAGKTFTIITGIMERVRMGLTRKAVIAVPNHLVGQWAADWMKLYPGAKILAATNKDFSKPNRRRLFSRITTGNYDAVIVGHSSFGFIPVERATISELVQEEITHLLRAENDAKEAGEKRMAANLAKRIQKKRERIAELMNKPRDNVSHFEQMGIDHIVVDESHEFKNLEYSSAMQNITGMGNPSGSKRAFDLYSKLRWLSTQKNTGVTFATGTPISNSLVEMYAILRYLNRQGLVDRKLEAFDSWASAYASTENRIEYTASQKLKDRVIMATFHNVPEMLQLYNEFADSITMDDLKRSYKAQMEESNRKTGRNDSTDFPVPKVEKNGRQLDLGDRDEAQGKYVDYLVARANRLEELGRENDPRVDNHLWLMSDARKMALDIRLVDPSAKPGKNNKINRAAKNIKRIYDKWADVKGTQLVFCDLSTPLNTAQGDAKAFIKTAAKMAKVDKDAGTQRILEGMSTYHEKWGYLRHLIEAEIDAISDHREGETSAYMARREALETFLNEGANDSELAALTTADSGFSVYDDLKATLIRQGIPAGEIKFIHDATTPVKKQELFDMVNRGAIRVLIGSTPKMGAGTNAQERMVALHHMDAPWRPSDVEQREGRLVRQGNSLYAKDPKGFLVEIRAYSTSQTFDAVMWQILERKQSMLDDFRSGRESIDGGDGDTAGYADFMAETTGNPAFKEKFKLEGEIEELAATMRRINTRRQSAGHSLKYNEGVREQQQDVVETNKAIAEKLKGVGNDFSFQGNDYKNDIAEVESKERERLKVINATAEAEHTPIKEAIFAKVDKKYPEADRQRDRQGRFSAQAAQADADADAYYQELLEKAGIGRWAKTTSFDRATIIKKEPQGATAGAERIRKAVNNLPKEDGGEVSFHYGDVKVTIKAVPTGDMGKDGKDLGLYDYKFFIDGQYTGGYFGISSSFAWHHFEPYLSMDQIRQNIQKNITAAESRLKMLENDDRKSAQTLDKMKFGDEQKLADKQARYAEVVQEVNALEAQMEEKRANETNAYIEADTARFGGDYQPHSGGTASVVANAMPARQALPPIAAEANKYYAGLDNGKFEEVAGTPVENSYGLEVFVYKRGDRWIGTERTTGMKFGVMASTRKDAIAATLAKIESSGSDKFKDAIAKSVEKGTVSPWYKATTGATQYALGEKGSTDKLGDVALGDLVRDLAKTVKGIEIVQQDGENGPVMIRTKSGKFAFIKAVDQVNPDEIQLSIGYGSRDKSNVAGLFSPGYLGKERVGLISLVKNRAGLWTLTHEFTHFLEDIGAISNADKLIINNKISALMAKDAKYRELMQDRSAEERRADWIGKSLAGIYDAKTVTGKILEKIKGIIDKIVNALGIRTAGGVVRDIKSGNIFNQAAMTFAPEGHTAFSVDESHVSDFAKELDDYREGKRKSQDPLTLGNTPYVLEKLGAEPLPLVMNPRTVKKVTEGKHSLTFETLKQLPAHLADPIMVFNSATQTDSLVVMTELQQDGKTIVAAIHLSKEHGRNVVNNIASVHPRQSEQHFINWIEQGLLRYMNKKKSRAWSVTSGLQLPTVRGSNPGVKDKILFDYDLVKGQEGAAQYALSDQAEELSARVATKVGARIGQGVAAMVGRVSPSAKAALPVIKQHWNEFWRPFSTVKDGDKLLVERYRAMGNVAKAVRFIEEIHNKLDSFPDAVKKDMFWFLNGDIPIENLPEDARETAQMLQRRTEVIGEMLVDRGILKEGQFEKYRGKYIHYMYAKHILGEDKPVFLTSTGKLNLAYTKSRNPNLTLQQRKELGLIEDASVAVPTGMGKALTDIAKFDYLATIAENPDWVWQPSVIKVAIGKPLATPVNGRTRRNVTMGIGKLVEELKVYDQMVAKHPTPEVAEIHKILHDALAKAEDASQNMPGDFVQLPTSKSYGPLAGMFVKKPIADDLMPVMNIMTDRGKLMNAIVEVQRVGMSTFKMGKVALNIPTAFRNMVSNIIQMNMRGRSLTQIPGDIIRSLESMKAKDAYYQEAQGMGLFSSNWFVTEINDVLNEFRKVKAGRWDQIMMALRNVAKYYGKIDDVSKLAIFRQEREAGKSVDEATLEAMKWGMDYSLTSRSIKGLRQTIMPFATYQYKIAPLIAEAFKKRPWVLAKFALIYPVAQAIAMSLHGLDDDDWEDLEKQLPAYIKKSGSMMILPWKTDRDQWQWVNLEYFFPWGNYLAIARDMKAADLGESLRDLGLSNPFLSMFYTGLSAREDQPPLHSYFGTPIYNNLDSAPVKAAKFLEFMANTWIPSMVTRQGAIGYAGKALVGSEDRWGREVTAGQALGRWFGLNIVSVSPEQSRAQASVRIQDLHKEMARIEADPSYDESDKAAFKTRMNEQLAHVAVEAPAAVLPITKGKGKDPVYDALLGLAERGALTSSPPSRAIEIAGIPFKMTMEQYRTYLDRSSEIARQRLSPLVSSPTWEQMSDRRKAETVAGIVTNARKGIRQKIKGEVAVANREKIIEEKRKAAQ